MEIRLSCLFKRLQVESRGSTRRWDHSARLYIAHYVADVAHKTGRMDRLAGWTKGRTEGRTGGHVDRRTLLQGWFAGVNHITKENLMEITLRNVVKPHHGEV